MFDLQTLGLFSGTALLLALAPGPDNLYVVSEAALRGASRGISITLGLCSGLLLHTLAVALGLAAVLQGSEAAFTLVKLLGGGYLLYLAWQTLRAGRSDAGERPAAPLSLPALYGRGVLMNISNPKVSVFFLAFLPQFADPARGNLAWQLALLGGLFMLCALLVFSTLSLLASRAGAKLQGSVRVQRLLNRVTALLFACLALRLFYLER